MCKHAIGWKYIFNLTKDMYPEYIKNSDKHTTKRQPNLNEQGI